MKYTRFKADTYKRYTPTVNEDSDLQKDDNESMAFLFADEIKVFISLKKETFVGRLVLYYH